ncbi:MAG TPA: DUF302 domain-containing protein [Candidatus Acidoferrum sp.]|jgi:uncharacterized protein (DUF302 family)
MNPASDNGLVHLSSRYSVDQTTERLESTLQAKSIQVFCHIDHSGEAEKIGMKMHPTQLLIFGNPKGGTPLMLASPTLAVDLPWKALIWQDAGNKVWITYNSPEYLRQRHNIPPELLKNIAVIEDLLKSVVAA